jgi:hypothetical protein
MRAFIPLLAAGLLLTSVPACGGTEVVTVTTTQVVTQTVETTETVTETIRAEPAIYVPQAGGTPEFKPRELFTGVSSVGWVVKEWISYGGETAEALAYTEQNDCEPDCASGTRTRVDVTIRLSSRIPYKGVPAYGYLVVTKSSDESAISSGTGEDRAVLCREGE